MSCISNNTIINNLEQTLFGIYVWIVARYILKSRVTEPKAMYIFSFDRYCQVTIYMPTNNMKILFLPSLKIKLFILANVLDLKIVSP